jgi:hypothetical protein
MKPGVWTDERQKNFIMRASKMWKRYPTEYKRWRRALKITLKALTK